MGSFCSLLSIGAVRLWRTIRQEQELLNHDHFSLPVENRVRKNITMESIEKQIEAYKNKVTREGKKKFVSHATEATVREIAKVIPLTDKYNFGFWLMVVARAKVSYSEIFGILKGLEDAKNKGSLLYWQLKKRFKPYVKKPKKLKTLSLFGKLK